jgi:hypothetical protein
VYSLTDYRLGKEMRNKIVLLIPLVLIFISCGVGGYYIHMDEEDIKPRDLKCNMDNMSVFMNFDSFRLKKVNAKMEGIWSVNETIIEPVVKSALAQYCDFVFTDSSAGSKYYLDVELYDFHKNTHISRMLDHKDT